MPRKKTSLSLPNRPLRKAAAAIHVSGQLSLLERKLVNVMLLNAYDKLGTQKVFTIPTAMLMAMVGWTGSKNVDTLKAALSNIMSTQIEFDLLETDHQPAHWRKSNMIAEAEIVGGICSYEYPTKLAEMLADPDVYALIDVNVQNRFKKGSALTLFENCLRFKGVGRTRFVPLQVWRKLLGAEAATYDEFKHFANMVIKPAVAEVNKVSNILVEPEYRKEGRRVVEMRFIITQNPQGQLHETVLPSAIEEIRGTETYRRMMQIGLGDMLAVTWIQADAARAAQTIAYVEKKLKDKAIKSNISGYARRVFESGSSLELFPDDPAPAAPQERAGPAPDEQPAAEARARAITAAILALSVAQMSAHVDAYEGQGGKASTYNRETGKFRNVLQKTAFMTWLRARIAPDVETATPAREAVTQEVLAA
ncbi:replication initiation protein [Paraburkholderia sp. BR10882]|uniref:replication initiation protein n=1 Tax=unclassified Paraburkholderia TaxID=2615204 RepID=UPI0034CEEACE